MNRIRELRKKLNINQKKMAELLNIHQSSISEWEKGSYNPNETQKLKLCELFNYTLDYLMGYTDINLKETPSDNKNTIVLFGRGVGKKEVEVTDDELRLIDDLLKTLKKNPKDYDI